jgi:hypothetical protein
VGDALPAKVVRINLSKVLIVLAAFLAPIAVAAGVAGGPMLESPRTLAVALGAAWAVAAFVGYGFYGGKRCLEAATLLLVVVLAMIVAYARPWAGGGAEENVVFQYEASFAYLGSTFGSPIENLTLRFPCPTVENIPPPILVPNWALYYQDENGQLHLQMTNQVVIGWMGNRNNALGILAFGLEENTQHGAKISYRLDNFYPHEVFFITTALSVSTQNSDKIKLSENEDNRMVAGYFYYPLERKIDISFWARLSRKTNDNFVQLEEFSRTAENAEYGWWWLYPS